VEVTEVGEGKETDIKSNYVRYQVLKAASMNFRVFWDVQP
jgi:hypothetical protein